MIPEVKCCTYFDSDENVEITIEKNSGDVVISKIDKNSKFNSKNKESKKVDKKYIMNLDIFFRAYDLDSWKRILDYDVEKEQQEANAYQYVLVNINDEELYISNYDLENSFGTEKNLFLDLKRYLNACFSEKLKSFSLSYHSFDGGGPQYSIETHMKGIFTWYYNNIYQDSNHENLCGAGYDWVCDFYPLRPGEDEAVITGDSPICPTPKQIVHIKVDDNLNISYTIEEHPL